jgi:ribonuclease HI
MKFAQINLNRSADATKECEIYLSKMKIDIAFIQEPGQKQKKIVDFAKYICIHDDYRDNTPVRACIIAHKKVKITKLTNFCTPDITTCILANQENGRDSILIVASVYFPDDKSDFPCNIIDQIIDHSKKVGLQLIICCDANAHHKNWGMNRNNLRGEILNSFLTQHNLTINNVGNAPTYVGLGAETIIDLTISTKFISNKFCNWKVQDSIHLSDHRMITFDIKALKQREVIYRNVKETNWVKYEKDIENLINKNKTALESNNLNTAAEKLDSILTKAYHDNCPKKTLTNNSTELWWNKHLEILKKEVCRAKNTKVRNPSPSNIDFYNRKRKIYKNSINYYSKKSLEDFISNIESTDETARLMKVMQLKPTPITTNLKDKNGIPTLNDFDTLRLMNCTHFQNNKEIDTETDIEEINFSSDNDYFSSVITNEEIVEAIDSFSAYKSPGPDEIAPALIQRAKNAIIEPLKHIFTLSLCEGRIPTSWSKIKAIYIRKPGKSDYTDPKAYRPISLMQTNYKTLEKVLDKIIKSELSPNALHMNQFAYRTGKSAEHAIHKLIEAIEKSKQDNEIGMAAFIDISAAFDNIRMETLRKAAIQKHIRPSIINWIIKSLQSRKIITNLNETEIIFMPDQGIAQGSILSPLLWSIVVDEIVRLLNNQGIKCFAYADDICIYVTGKFEATVRDSLGKALNMVLKWCLNTNLSINPNKTEILIFAGNKRLQYSSISFNNIDIKYSKSAKYLGVIIDNKLTWNDQIDYIENKARVTLMTTRNLIGNNWGLKPSIMRWVYQQILLPRVTYGAMAWWQSLTQTSKAERIEKIQRQALSTFAPVYKSLPLSALMSAYNIRPLDTEIMKKAILTMIRIGDYDKAYLPLNSHANILPPLSKILKLNKNQIKFDYCSKTKSVRKFKLYFNVNEIEELENQFLNYNSNTKSIYTDGSGLDSKSGIGIKSEDLKIEISERTIDTPNINKTEMIAIIRACDELLQKNVANENIEFLTDSRNLLHALNNKFIDSELTITCQNKLNELADKNDSVSIKWIKAHCGTKGNEDADKLAKGGTKKAPTAYHSQFTKLETKEVKLLLERWQYEEHKQRTINSNTSKSLFHQITRFEDTNKDIGWTSLNRCNLRLLMALTTGHNSTRKRLKLTNQLPIHLPTTCRLCNEKEESSKHFLFECEHLKYTRKSCFGRESLNNEFLKRMCPSQFLRFIRISNLNKLLLITGSSNIGL